MKGIQKPVKQSLKKDQKLVFKTDYRYIKLPSVFKTFVLSIFELPLKKSFTVEHYNPA